MRKQILVDKIKTHYLFIIAFLISIGSILPSIILGGDTLIGIHDYFDSNIAWNVILARSGFLFAPSDTIVPGIMNGLPRLSFGSEFNVFVWLFCFMDPFSAHIVNQFFIQSVGFAGMYLLLKNHFLKDESYTLISLGVAICFAILPFWPPAGLSISSLPLALCAFMNIQKKNDTKFDWLILVLIPFYSSLVFSYIFFLAGLSIVWFLKLINERNLNLKFFQALLLMGFVFLFVEYRLVIDMLFNSTYVSHRIEFLPTDLTPIESLQRAISNFMYGQYHAATVQFPVVLIAVGIAFLLIVIGLLLRHIFKNNSARRRAIIDIENVREYVIPFILFLFMCGLVSLWFGFWYSELLVPLKENYSIFRMFMFVRLHWLHPLLWYILFALSIVLIHNSASLKGKPIGRYIAIGFITIQIIIAFPISWGVSPWAPNSSEPVTYNEFYAEDLFSRINEDIGLLQNTYSIINIGIHPAISQFNGFHTLDGYSSNYPLEYKYQFRNIIAFELEKNEGLREYYDGWGSRCYIMVDELDGDYYWTKYDDKSVSNLELNVSALLELNCEYVFSAVNITNSVANSLSLMGVYEDSVSIWRIYVYEVM